ncbi:DNA segregation ATPase, FtsK/SpoIIIE family [Mycobacteroides abscessus subsp. abscessus]|uniref:FtsK/SpoIIIE domain-containing protein n=1 Tax=Mycobacteroides abscessus TaxID=36809 RepID=UPI0009A64B55|nr:FtsK/SpoIIIE domain-containing protein [Mycobacteroides abscessus]SKV12305.1 DNA segregation ATPase, FtsK/SpoIIIE family [Mycobacteroides abscessus subsp. abscessus]
MRKYNRKYNPHYAQRRSDAREDYLWKQDFALHTQADAIRAKIPETVRAEQEKLDKEFERLVAEQRADLSRVWVDLVSEPVQQFAGGVRGPVTLTHWKTPPLTDMTSDRAGPLMRFSVSGSDDVLTAASANPALRTPDGIAWVERAREALEEVRTRYAFLPHLLNNDYTARLFAACGLTRDVVRVERAECELGSAKFKVTITHVPTLIAANVTPDGLELTYAHRVGDSAKSWEPKTPALVGAFKSLGARADNLKVKEDADGNVVLDFDDAPSGFPAAIAPAPPQQRAPRTVAEASDRYRNARWVLGVDRRGNDISLPMENFQHALVTGETGGGKSVWIRSQIEALRAGDRYGAGGWTIYILDGKGSDAVSLRDLPNVGMVAPSTDLALCVWMIFTVEREMRRRIEEAKRKKAAGDPRAYEFPPILLLIDEWGTTATSLRTKYGKDAEKIFAAVDAILRLGREPRVHVALASQTIRKTGSAAVPGSWFVNFKLIVSLGNPDTETLQSAFPEGQLRARAGELGPRIRGKKGRGMYADADKNKVEEFQSYYAWSPGTTSLDPNAPASVRPPNDQVRASWEAWDPISADVPALSPRVAPRVDGPEWRADLDTIMSTPAVAISGPDGSPLHGTEHWDPNNPAWVGAEPVDNRVASIPLVGFDAPAPKRAEPKRENKNPLTETVRAEEPQSPADAESAATEQLKATDFTSLEDALSDPAHRALIAEHLRAKGISVPGLTDVEPSDTDLVVEPEATTPAVEPDPPTDNSSGDTNEDPVRARARALGLDLED